MGKKARKHVTQRYDHEFVTVAEGQQLCRVVENRGGNQYSVCDEAGVEFLVLLPAKFKRTVWIKRGDAVVVEVCEDATEAKIRGIIASIPAADDVKELKRTGQWTLGGASESDASSSSDDDSRDSLDSLDELVPNMNRVGLRNDGVSSSSSDDSSSSSSSDDDGR